MNSPHEDRTTLTNFFSAYFHEDWPCEADTFTEVVHAYLRTASPSDAARLRAEIIGFVEHERNNADLEDKLMSELGCYYLPSGDGFAASEWLLRVADLLATKTKAGG